MPITREADTVKDQSQEKAKAATPAPVRRPVPAPGRTKSFDEALAVGMKQYDNALRELAK